MVTLYDFELSAACYSVRLLLGFLAETFETVPVDIYPGEDDRADWFRALSPEGVLPVLVDGEHTVVGSRAALLHLAATRPAAAAWHPVAAATAIDDWIAVADRAAASAGVARWAVATGAAADLEVARRAAHAILRAVDEHLWFGERAGHDWLVAGTSPSLADIALFPDLALSEEGGVSRQDYPAIRRWIDRFRRLPGFVVMSGVFAPGKQP